MAPPKKMKIHIGSMLFPILYTLLLFLVAAVIYLYSNGYQFDIFNKALIQSGVLGVESSPIAAEIYIDDQLIGKTPKSTSLEVGTYRTTLKLDGYYDWSKEVEIVEGKSTPIYPWLIKNKPEGSTKWTSSGTLEKYWVSPYFSHALILTREEDSYTLWEYTLNPSLWDFSSNPSIVLELDTNNIDITMSPSGQLALLKITAASTSQYYIIDTNSQQKLAELKPLAFDPQVTYTITWANNNSYLILESAEKILAYSTKLNTSAELFNKTAGIKYTWTMMISIFYMSKNSTDTDSKFYSYRLKQIQLDGTNSKYIIDNFYFNKTDEYITGYRSNGFPSVEFTSAPESTLSAGSIDFIEVNQKAQGVYMRTNLATYWYNIKTQKLMMISPYPATLVAFNPNSRELLFKNSNQIGVYTFDKTEGDHTVIIGTKSIKNITDVLKVQNLRWLPNTYNIIYSEEGSIFVADRDGENKSFITNPEKLLTFLFRDSQDSILTFTTDEQGRIIVSEYDIH
jgi:hypothetical protein